MTSESLIHRFSVLCTGTIWHLHDLVVPIQRRTFMSVGDQVGELSNARHPVAESAFMYVYHGTQPYKFLRSLSKRKLRGKNPGSLKDAKS